MTKHFFLSILIIFQFFYGCKNDDADLQNESQSLYFPPINSTTWETLNPASLNWNLSNLEILYQYLEDNNTRAFLILKNGKIVVEKYFGQNLLQSANFDKDSKWYWASAGKTLTAFMVGIAQEKGFIDIDHPTSHYLGNGWTSLSTQQENLISIKNQLTMTTGLEYQGVDLDCTLPDCLQYKSAPNISWYYHNAPYTLLTKVVQNATQTNFSTFMNAHLAHKIGMSGLWVNSGYNEVYYSTARDMARFGILVQNKGKWEEVSILNDSEYVNAMINTSQNINPSYGYLWWLNGKNSVIFPGFSTSLPISVTPNAPQDMYSAMGKNGQTLDIIPSENMIVIRMGETPDDSLVPINFHNEMWGKIRAVLP